MRICFVGAMLALLLVLLSACYLPSTPTPLPPVTSTPVATVVPTIPPSPPPEPTPTPLPSPTPPVPTIDVTAIVNDIAAAEARIATEGIQTICLCQQGIDFDAGMEWVGLYVLPTDPPQLLGFVLDGNDWYDLGPPENEEYQGLGQYPTCEMEVRDLNADGWAELAIWGHADTHTDYLHIFAWSDGRYALLGAFEGKGGVHLENTDGDLSEEVVVRLQPVGDLVREIVYTWDGTHYAWTWDRYSWFYLDRPHVYLSDSPLHALVSFYLALNDRDMASAYGLLSPTGQSAQGYEDWTLGFVSMLGIEVGVVNVVSQEGGQASVAAQVVVRENVNGRVVATLSDVEWLVGETADGWRLESGTSEVLEQWEIPYYP
jgi:hypothetical protein